MTDTKKIVVVSAGLSVPSNTALLADRTAAKVQELASAQNLTVQLQQVELRELGHAIMDAMITQFVSAELQAAIDLVQAADALIVATPVYKAGPSGLFTSFFQVLDNDSIIGTPVLLTGSAGSARHALVVDEQLRGLFAYLRAVTAPTALFAAPEDWGAGLEKRIARAATELNALLAGGFREAVRGANWGTYQHSFSTAGGPLSNGLGDQAANSADSTGSGNGSTGNTGYGSGIDFNSELMRLAAGGQ